MYVYTLSIICQFKPNLSIGVPPASTSGNGNVQTVQTGRKRERKMRRSTGGTAIGLADPFPRPDTSRASSLPEKVRSFSSSEKDWGFAAELQGKYAAIHDCMYADASAATLLPARQLPKPSFANNYVVSELSSESPRMQYTPRSTPDASDGAYLPPQRPSSGTPRPISARLSQEWSGGTSWDSLRKSTVRPESSASIRQGKQPEGNASTSRRPDRSELAAEVPPPRPEPRMRVSRTKAQAPSSSLSSRPKPTFMQPKTLPLRNIDAYTTSPSPSPNPISAFQSSRFNELRTARRMPSSRELNTESVATAARGDGLPSITPRRGFVSESSPLSRLERRLDRVRTPERTFHGYASEQDVSQLGSTVWDSELGR